MRSERKVKHLKESISANKSTTVKNKVLLMFILQLIKTKQPKRRNIAIWRNSS